MNEILFAPVIDQFKDSRSFLKARFLYLKSERPHFSFQYCSKKLKTSNSYLKQIFSGKKKIGLNRISAIARLFELSQFEEQYFGIWILQESIREEKLNGYLKQVLSGFSKNAALKVKTRDLYFEGSPFPLQYWLYGALIELLHFKDFKEDQIWILSHLIDGDRLKWSEIQNAIQDLLEANVLKRDVEGGLIPGKNVLFMNDEFDDSSFLFYQSGLAKANQVLSEVSRYSPCEFLNGTFAFDEAAIKKVRNLFNQFRDEVVELSLSSKDPNTLIFLNSHFFALSSKKEA